MSDIDRHEKSLFIFGRDVSKIPCFRNSMLYGILGGISMGLGHFMFTSRPGRASNVAVYSFSLITLIYWTQCRYKFSRTKFEMMRVQELMRQNMIYEGSADADRIDEKLKEELSDA